MNMTFRGVSEGLDEIKPFFPHYIKFVFLTLQALEFYNASYDFG